MFDFPVGEFVNPSEQVAVARAVAIMAARDGHVANSERHFVEDLMGRMMLLPEERDLVRKEFEVPSSLFQVAKQITNREARVFLLYQAICASLADNRLEPKEINALLELGSVFEFNGEATKQFIEWVRDSLELRERGQQILVEL